MYINLKDSADSITIRRQLNVSNLLQGWPDILAYEPLDVDLTVRVSAGSADVEGELKLPVTLSCSRCLSPIQETVVIPFRERFVRQMTDIPKDEQDDVNVVSDDKFDLTPYAEEAVVLGLPYAPVCGDDCLGLCPVCGTNRNERDCGCDRRKIDPRLAGLADFFKE